MCTYIMTVSVCTHYLLQISKWSHQKLIIFTFSCSAARFVHLNLSSLIVKEHILLILNLKVYFT